jgi:hypothetical protein
MDDAIGIIDAAIAFNDLIQLSASLADKMRAHASRQIAIVIIDLTL